MRHEYRVQTRQPHPVPDKKTAPRGPFPPELFFTTPICSDYEPQEDRYLPGATAQNDFKPDRLFRCRDCLMDVYESETPYHECLPPSPEPIA